MRRRVRAGKGSLEARPADGFYRRLVLANMLIFIGLLAGAQAAFAAPGDLDPTFDGDGKLTANFERDDYASALALQPGGKAVVGGRSCHYVFNEYGDYSGTVCGSLLARYLDDGSPDTDFGEGGRAPLDIGTVSTLITQADRKLVSGGSLDGDFALARHEADGAPDTGFGQDGRVVTDFGDSSTGVRNVTVQSDGKTLAAGHTKFFGSGQDRIVLARYEPNGSLDASFGEGGKVIADFARGDTQVGGFAFLPDGGLVAAGSGPCDGTSRGFVLVRYNADGSLDTGFGEGGKACTVIGRYDDAHASSVAVQPDGKIVAAGDYDLERYERQGLAVARYKADGTPDAAFGNNGKGIAELAGSFDAGSLILQPGGEIAVSGIYRGDGFNGFGLARYRADGTLDKGFGNGGAISTDFVGDSSSVAYDQVARALAFQDDGKLVAAGYLNPPCGHTCASEIAVARYDATPSVDGPNTAPVARGDRATTKESRRTVFNVLRNDSDPDGDRLTAARSTRSKHGNVRCGTSGRCAYVPDRGYSGKDTFKYVAKDGRGGADTATVRLRIRHG